MSADADPNPAPGLAERVLKNCRRRRENDRMKDFFEDLGKRLEETAETVTNKAGEAIEIQRMKSQMRNLARGNAVDLMELGRMIYDRYKDGEEVEEAAEGLCAAIREREESIGKYEKKIAKIKGASECGHCGRMVARDMAFCPYCGEKIDTSAFEDEEEEEASAGEEAGETYADAMKKKAADVAETAAEKADEAARKVGDAAEKAAQKTADMAQKAAEKVGEAAEKLSETADSASDSSDKEQ